ncbi:DUF3147 family protein [Poriferisphaera sp. WC338]|uniref:DUF3147 family protein n=1 Tax=Poriferisphaera sp. WC338 TaxID=3425129 RepID=UPI003D814C9D
MFYAIIKLFVTAGLIVIISEVGQRVSWLAGLLASLPLVSYLAMIWIYVDTKDQQKVADLSSDIVWLILPTIPFFIVLPILLKKFAFFPALGLATLVMFAGYFIMAVILKRYGILV